MAPGRGHSRDARDFELYFEEFDVAPRTLG